MLITGVDGQLRVDYRWAATLHKWRLTSESTLGHATSYILATVLTVDEYWCTQKPLTVGLWMGNTWWMWKLAVPASTIVAGRDIELLVEGNPVSCNALKGMET